MAAGWLSFAVTAVGLGSLITQASAIQERLDPYFSSRTAEHLGTWIRRQPKKGTLRLSQPTPIGPVIHGKLTEGFCGRNAIGVSRLPQEVPGKATWTGILAIFHERQPVLIRSYGDEKRFVISKSNSMGSSAINDAGSTYDLDIEAAHYHDKLSWPSLRTQPLTRVDSTTCIDISRTTLITILIICNARTMFRYSDASGHRASYASYCGHFYIEWPLGGPAMVHFHPHDSHSAAKDVYPPMFPVRVDKCVQMLAGIITGISTHGKAFQCAFPGRKSPGRWILKHQVKGFPGAHGSRHLYNLMGGRVYEVDFLHAGPMFEDDAPAADALHLSLPSTEKGSSLTLVIGKPEQEVLDCALDNLPWSSMSWSIHRGLRDILVAYAKPTMDRYRHSLASQLRTCIVENASLFEANGWSAGFVRDSMADVAANSVLAGCGNSGDSVRVVTDAAMLLSTIESAEAMDETIFWREGRDSIGEGSKLPMDGVVALTKCFVLEWSNEFDYQMYHDLPPGLLFR